MTTRLATPCGGCAGTARKPVRLRRDARAGVVSGQSTGYWDGPIDGYISYVAAKRAISARKRGNVHRRNAEVNEPESRKNIFVVKQSQEQMELKRKLNTSITRGQHERSFRPVRQMWRLYLETDDAYTAMRVLVCAQQVGAIRLGFYRFDLVGVEPGSVMMTIRAWAKKVSQKRQVRVVASQLVQTAEAMTVDKALAENANQNATAVAQLIDASKDVDSMVLDFGSLQLAKYRDEDGKIHVRARALGSKDLASKRLDDAVLSEPREMFKVLERDPDSIGFTES